MPVFAILKPILALKHKQNASRQAKMGIFGVIFVIFWCKFDVFKAKFGSFGLFLWS